MIWIVLMMSLKSLFKWFLSADARLIMFYKIVYGLVTIHLPTCIQRQELEGCKSVNIASYYRPKENDLDSFNDEFKKSLQMISQLKGDVWVIGYLNFPNLARILNLFPPWNLAVTLHNFTMILFPFRMTPTWYKLSLNQPGEKIYWICS